MNPKNDNKSEEQIKQIIKGYSITADQIIRKMIGVLTQAHKKVDEAAYREWRDKLKTK